MGARSRRLGAAVVGFISALAAYGRAESLAPVDRPLGAAPPPRDEPTPSIDTTPVSRLAERRGFTFHPSAPRLGAFRFALGALFDAIDPQVMYGFNARVPQLVLDARYGLGRGWSLKGHFNSMFVTTELLFGGSYAARSGAWSFEGSASVGIYVGKLAHLGFDALVLSPQYRPEITLGYDFGHVAVSLRASLLLMGPDRVRVGDVWGGLDNANVFAGHSEMLFVENTTRSDSVWYFGAGVLTTRAFYALWLLFPDSPGLYTYPRVVAGYEF